MRQGINGAPLSTTALLEPGGYLIVSATNALQQRSDSEHHVPKLGIHALDTGSKFKWTPVRLFNLKLIKCNKLRG